MRMNRFLWIWLFMLFVSSTWAQKQKELSLKEALSLSYEQNSTIQIAYEDLKAAIADYKSTNAIFMPQVVLSENYIYTNNPMQVFGVNLQQTSITSADFAPDKLNNPDATDNWNTSVMVQMPLFNLDKIYERKMAKEVSKSKYSSLQQVYNLMEFEVKKAYYALQLAHERVRVMEEALSSSRSSEEVVASLKREGLVTQADKSMSMVYALKTENGLLAAKNDYRQANRYLLFLLKLDADIEVLPTDRLGEISIPTEPMSGVVPVERADLMAQRHYVQALENRVKQNKASWIPSLNAMGSYDLNSKEIFSGSSNSYWVGVSLQWKLFQGGMRISQNKKHKAEYRKAQHQLLQMEDKANMELQNTLDQLKLYEKQTDIMYQAFLQSQESYAIKFNRYGEGLEKTSDILQSKSEMEQVHLHYLQSQYQYSLAYFQLQWMLKK